MAEYILKYKKLDSSIAGLKLQSMTPTESTEHQRTALPEIGPTFSLKHHNKQGFWRHLNSQSCKKKNHYLCIKKMNKTTGCDAKEVSRSYEVTDNHHPPLLS